MLQNLFILFSSFLFLLQSGAALYEFGSFESASSFAFSDAGFIYVTDSEANEITKLDTLGKQILSIGGFGSGTETFDSPEHIYSTTLNLYVCDKNNDRIVFFDKDLNYISELNSNNLESEQFAYPTASAVSPQGDLYVLDSDNQRILKYDLNGNFLMQIGNYDSGDYYLNAPTDFTITNRSEIVVPDGKKIIFFDQYGNGLRSFIPPEEVKAINFTDNFLLMISEKKIFYISFSQPDLKLHSWRLPKGVEQVKDAAIWNNRIYLLTSEKIIVYPFN